MLPPDVSPHEGADSPSGPDSLEREVAQLRADVAALRGEVAELTAGLGQGGAAGARRSAAPTGGMHPLDPRRLPTAYRAPREQSDPLRAFRGDGIESLVGRYGMPALAALLILMAVGALIKVAVQHGLLTPSVRIAGGAMAAVLVGAAGLLFRRRGEVRYGNVLLALALAILDLVAWGAGPRLHLVPTATALAAVDVVAIALGALALSDGSEFLFVVAIAGALSAPFVTSDGGGTALTLLLYGGVVLAGALRAVRDPSWTRAFGVLAAGALVYALAAAALPMSPAWYGPFLVALFGGAMALTALLFAEPSWRSDLPRAYLAASVIGTVAGWDAIARGSVPVALAAAGLLAAVTHASLLVRSAVARMWTASALVLPWVSLGLALAAMPDARGAALVIGTWAAFSLGAWGVERGAGDDWRAATHLLAAAVLGGVGVAVGWWTWPLALVAGLSGWAVTMTWIGRNSLHPHALLGAALVLMAAALSAVDQLASRWPYTYVPFATRSSASAACVAAGLAVAGWVVADGRVGATRWASRGIRIGSLVGFLIVWGRMEVAQAFSRDLSAFLLTSYYAACGVASIVAGRRLGIGRLRSAGLLLALYAGLKGLVVVTDIVSVGLRIGAYAAVGVFLLGAGWLYRNGATGLTDTADRASQMG